VVAEAQTMPFLTERRVVVVRNADRYLTGDSGEALLPYLASPNSTTVLILLMNAIDKRTKFYKACEKSAEFIECPALSAKEATHWLKGEAKRLGRKIDGGAADALIGRAGAHLSDVSNALTLVINFVGDERAPITEEAVRAACSDVAEEEIWALTDAIAASETGKALHALRKLLDLGKHPDEIIGTINWLLKTAYRVEQGDSGVHRFVAEKVRPLAKRYGTPRLIRAFALCTDTQFSMRTTGVDGPLAVELLVVKLAYSPKARA
jgi:DNA polymerase-3 subunit delta